MKLTTFNINGIRARLPRLVEWLDREKPYVDCLKELKCADESMAIADIEAAGDAAGAKSAAEASLKLRMKDPEAERLLAHAEAMAGTLAGQ